MNEQGDSRYMSTQSYENLNKTTKESAMNTQIGGTHYKSYPIQPIEYCMKNNLNYCQSNIVKYATRYKDKNGKQDLEKIKHYVDLLIEMEYSNDN